MSSRAAPRGLLTSHTSSQVPSSATYVAQFVVRTRFQYILGFPESLPVTGSECTALIVTSGIKCLRCCLRFKLRYC